MDVITDRCWADDSLDHLCDMVQQQDAATRLEMVLTHLRPLRNHPDQHTQASDAVDLTSALEPLRSRIQDPRTPADDRADLLALLGHALTLVAWKIRGTGPASSVGKKARAGFREHLEEADEALIAALQIYPQHPGAATSRLRTARGLGAEGGEWWARFHLATSVQPTLFKAHDLMLMALCAKWYGSDEDMFGFGHMVAQEAPPGDPVVAMLPMAHGEYINSVQGGRTTLGPRPPRPEQLRRQDEEAVMAASWKWAGDGSRPAPAHPYALNAHNLFGWYLGNSERFRERGRWHLAQTQRRIGFQPWVNLSDNPGRSFTQLHDRLGLLG